MYFLSVGARRNLDKKRTGDHHGRLDYYQKFKTKKLDYLSRINYFLSMNYALSNCVKRWLFFCFGLYPNVMKKARLQLFLISLFKNVMCYIKMK